MRTEGEGYEVIQSMDSYGAKAPRNDEARHPVLDTGSINVNGINPHPNSTNSHSSLRIQPSPRGRGEINRHAGLDPGSINVNALYNNNVYKPHNIGYNSDMKHHYYFCKNLMNPSPFTPHSSHKCAAFSLTEVFHPLRRSKKIAFTLAEVLITLGIIGVVAALTIPSLIAKHQKHVLYTQFRKAASQLENAINQYNYENGCPNEIIVDNDGTGDYVRISDNLCINANSGIYSYEGMTNYLGDKLGSMFHVAQWITYENNEEVCKNYKNTDGKDICSQEATSPGDIKYKNGYGFITTDNILIIPYDDASMYGYIDTNGPNKNPNKYGRDIFAFDLRKPTSARWGEYDDGPSCDSKRLNKWCGSQLIIENKMNY